jgi:hypothetical protein
MRVSVAKDVMGDDTLSVAPSAREQLSSLAKFYNHVSAYCVIIPSSPSSEYGDSWGLLSSRSRTRDPLTSAARSCRSMVSSFSWVGSHCGTDVPQISSMDITGGVSISVVPSGA